MEQLSEQREQDKYEGDKEPLNDPVCMAPPGLQVEPPSEEESGMRVWLNVYDVLPDYERVNRVLNDYMGAGGAFHAGVVIQHPDQTREWAFGGCEEGTGVFCAEPLIMADEEGPYTFNRRVEMGYTQLTNDEVRGLLTGLMRKWKGDSYDLTRHNCCHFAEELCEVLQLEEEFPPWINKLAGTAAYVEDQYNAAREAAAEMDREYKIQENYAAACARAKEIDEQYAVSEQVAQAKVSMQAAMSKFNEDYEISRTASQKAAELDAEYNLSQRANETFSSMRHSWYAWWGSPSTMEVMTRPDLT